MNYENNGTKLAVWLIPGFSPLSHYKKEPIDKFKCDVSIVATQLYDINKFPDQIITRKKMIDDIIEDGTIDFKLYGPKKFELLYPKHYSGYIRYEETGDVFNSSCINISTHIITNRKGYINERCVLITGSGGLLFVDDVKGIEDVFVPDNECVIIKKDGYINQIKDLLKDKKRCEEIKENGQLKSLNNYTWSHWAKKIVDTLSIPDDFNWEAYTIINELRNISCFKDAYFHYQSIGKKSGMFYTRKSKSKNVQEDKKEEEVKDGDNDNMYNEIRIKYLLLKSLKFKKTSTINKCLFSLQNNNFQDIFSTIIDSIDN